jgi:DNA (cytosine-5)-methyltransferase 1
MTDSADSVYDHEGGTRAPWYRGRDITDEQRESFRRTALNSAATKRRGLKVAPPVDTELRVPRLNVAGLMPTIAAHHLPALSLFSGGGGLDLGFERAGYAHVASYDTLSAAGETLRLNRPAWTVSAGSEGDVRQVNWRVYRGDVAVLHGGPPCQPFSVAGRQRGEGDERNMLPEFVRAVTEVRPMAFVAENVAALAGPKFAAYLQDKFIGPLSYDYHVTVFKLSAHDFGVPQVRHRVFFVGFRNVRAARRFRAPAPAFASGHLPRGSVSRSTESLPPAMGVRAALGLSAQQYDDLAPTLRSTLTGPRHTTSILSSASAQRVWANLGIWPNGVARSRLAAERFPTPDGHLRLAVSDCALLQGFPVGWAFPGAVYLALGQIGNSVAPPVGYHVGLAVARALGFAHPQ